MSSKLLPILLSTAPLALLAGCSRQEAPPSGPAPVAASAASDGEVVAATPSASAAPEAAPAGSVAADAKPAQLLPDLKTFAASLAASFDAIPADRKATLEKVAAFVKERLDEGKPAPLLFICTHNSRRSHMGQTSATLAAAYYGLDGVEAFSGGTEATAFNPRAVAALKRLGYQIENPGGDNPRYQLTFAKNRPPIVAFSKKYDDAANPKAGFAAVMTCSQADKACPYVDGAALRVALPYVDPKVSDGTKQEAATYDERAKQIATEVFYAMSRVKG